MGGSWGNSSKEPRLWQEDLNVSQIHETKLLNMSGSVDTGDEPSHLENEWSP